MIIGYACINLSLEKSVTTNRSMIKSTFKTKGVDYVSELTLKNVKDLFKIMKWNRNNGVYLFRMSSDMIPWGDAFDISSMKDYDEISNVLKEVGDYGVTSGIRLTFHPGPFVVLCSPHAHVVKNSVTNMELHGKMMDLIGAELSPYNKINIHCNGTYGDKKTSMDRFCEVFKTLSYSVRSRLTVENDDKFSMYSVKDLMYIHEKTGIPIVFDYHHHRFCDGGIAEKEALELAMSTWPAGIKPVVHYAESREGNNPRAHADYISKLPDMYGHDIEIMVEAKAKDLAVLPYLNTKCIQ